MQYYLWINESQAGPYTESQLKSMWNSGSITSATPFWFEGASDWMPLSDMKHLFEQVNPPPVPQIIQAGGAERAIEKQILFESRKKSAGVACLLNFVIPGVGYMYAGRVIIGIFVFLAWGFFFLLGFVTFGITFFVCFLIWLVGIIDGFLCVDRANKKLAQKVLRS